MFLVTRTLVFALFWVRLLKSESKGEREFVCARGQHCSLNPRPLTMPGVGSYGVD
jgi:hypothetical protein